MSRDEREEAPPSAGRPSVTILARSLERTGGAEQQFAQLAIGLRQLGFPVRIVTFYRGDSLEEDVRRGGVAITCIEKRGRWDTLGFAQRAYRAIVQDPPAILQSFLVPPNILAALLGMLRRDIRIVWGVRASDMDVRRYDWTHRCFKASWSFLLAIRSSSSRLSHLLVQWRPSHLLARSRNKMPKHWPEWCSHN